MCRQILVKQSNIKFHENLLSGFRDFTYGQRAMTKPVGTLLATFVAKATNLV
jgi:hypothetical protein